MSRRRKPERSVPDIRGALYPTIDLHGLSADEAARRTELWILDRQAEGERVVRIITGRGLHSAGLPVLPSVVEDLLRSLQRDTVRRYEKEPGGGVYRVTLHPAKQPVSRPPSAPVRHPPDLVRRAEEALRELGVEPTPVLIEAEIRRMAKEEER